MAPLIPDGIYNIRNGQFTNFVADLTFPHGPIVARPKRDYDRKEKWLIVNVGGGGNLVTIENLSIRGSFAEAQEFPGASLVGSPNAELWTIIKVDGGKYTIQSVNPSLVWELPRGIDRERIKLNYHSGRENTKWYFDPVSA